MLQLQASKENQQNVMQIIMTLNGTMQVQSRLL